LLCRKRTIYIHKITVSTEKQRTKGLETSPWRKFIAQSSGPERKQQKENSSRKKMKKVSTILLET
jgi:hypothetical protein